VMWGARSVAQHLWIGFDKARWCEACLVWQGKDRTGWTPAVNPICPGDDQDGGRRVIRRRPDAPSGAPRERVLESA
jgi:hypothetical protein